MDGVDGVILLRPTVSPAVYKQQVGRALSAGGENTPVIFDIVMNIENLCPPAESALPTCCLYTAGETVGRSKITPSTPSTWIPSFNISIQ